MSVRCSYVSTVFDDSALRDSYLTGCGVASFRNSKNETELDVAAVFEQFRSVGKPYQEMSCATNAKR